jgi:uncharacterized membrane protein YesL
MKVGVLDMQLMGMTGKFFRVCEIISKLAYLNLLWIFFTVLGLGVFGFMPATIALFAVTRKWVMGDKDVPVFKTFWTNYRGEFFKSTLFGVVLFVIGYIIYFDLVILPTGGLFNLLRLGVFIFGLLYAIVLLYIFPLYVHYDWKKKLYLKYALILGASHPHFTLLIVAGIAALYYTMITIPGMIPFFSVSILAYIIMWSAYQVMRKMEISQGIDHEAVMTNQVVEAK